MKGIPLTTFIWTWHLCQWCSAPPFLKEHPSKGCTCCYQTKSQLLIFCLFNLSLKWRVAYVKYFISELFVFWPKLHLRRSAMSHVEPDSFYTADRLVCFQFKEPTWSNEPPLALRQHVSHIYLPLYLVLLYTVREHMRLSTLRQTWLQFAFCYDTIPCVISHAHVPHFQHKYTMATVKSALIPKSLATQP